MNFIIFWLNLTVLVHLIRMKICNTIRIVNNVTCYWVITLKCKSCLMYGPHFFETEITHFDEQSWALMSLDSSFPLTSFKNFYKKNSKLKGLNELPFKSQCFVEKLKLPKLLSNVNFPSSLNVDTTPQNIRKFGFWYDIFK